MYITDAIDHMLKNGYREVPGKVLGYNKENIYVSLISFIASEQTWFMVTDNKTYSMFFSPWIEPVLNAKNFEEYCILWERAYIADVLEKYNEQ